MAASSAKSFDTAIGVNADVAGTLAVNTNPPRIVIEAFLSKEVLMIFVLSQWLYLIMILVLFSNTSVNLNQTITAIQNGSLGSSIAVSSEQLPPQLAASYEVSIHRQIPPLSR